MSDDGKSAFEKHASLRIQNPRCARSEFWQEQGDEAIFAAAWEMICMVEESKHGRKPTFDRTVTKVIRNGQESPKRQMTD